MSKTCTLKVIPKRPSRSQSHAGQEPQCAAHGGDVRRTRALSPSSEAFANPCHPGDGKWACKLFTSNAKFIQFSPLSKISRVGHLPPSSQSMVTHFKFLPAAWERATLCHLKNLSYRLDSPHPVRGAGSLGSVRPPNHPQPEPPATPSLLSVHFLLSVFLPV